jgi:uncharacterized protein (DUF2252 family)
MGAMPLEYVEPDDLLPVAERRLAGQRLRHVVPRSRHAEWSAPSDRRDPREILQETSRHRISSLLPIRYGRMQRSAFAFMRGSAAIMAADLAHTPTSSIWVQACGDCHLANFGTIAALDGTPVFDINDFDETLPAPFEWDVKRLAASFAVDARGRGMSDRAAHQLARTVTRAYRLRMAKMMRLDPLSVWQSRIDVLRVLRSIENDRLRERELKRLDTAVAAQRAGYPKLLVQRKGAWRIRTRPPLVLPLSGQNDDTHELVARTAFESYKFSLPEERMVLLDRYRLVDVAFKVVGIGSVGTFCAIGLFVTRDDATLLLQLKEAQESALAPHAAPSVYANQGQRVVTGQRILQGERDVFLGWTQELRSDQHCYVRQLKDSRLASVASELAEDALPYYAILCGNALARAHARSSDAARISGYLGSGDAFDVAIADFAIAYAGQVESDWRLFVEAIKSGAIETRDE